MTHILFNIKEFSRRILLIFTVGVCSLNHLQSQVIIRQNLGCFGSLVQNSGVFVRQTVGQPVNIDVISNTINSLRQGFQQPVFLNHLENLDSNFSFVVFPNPFKEGFTVQLDNLGTPPLIRVIDLDGRLIFQNTFENIQHTNIDAKSWPVGTYILIVISCQQASFSKLIKIQ